MKEAHRMIVDRHEDGRTVVESDGTGFFDLPRWLLPSATRGDDVLAVTVEAQADRAVITIVRDSGATARAKSEAAAAVEQLKRRDPGGDVQL
jgi:Protein of unknown function (DUF3006)